MAQNATPASFEEAKELARRAMLERAARANSSEDDATPSEQQAPEPADTDDSDQPAPAKASPSEEDEPEDRRSQDADEDEEDDEEEEDESDDDSDGDPDESDESDDDESDEEERPARPESKRKSSRRSKRIAKLQSEIAELRQAREQDEERLLQRLEQEQARRAALESEKRQREAEDRQLEVEMQEYLGSDDEYQAAVEAALRGDVFEAEKARAWHERRQIVGKLSRRAEAKVNERAAQIFWDSAGNLPGVDKQVLQEKPFGEVLKHLHQAGQDSVRAELQKEVAKRDQKIARLEAQLKEKKVKTAARSGQADPVEGGAPVPARKEKSIYEQALDPATRRIDRDKFNELRRRAGLSSLA